MIKGNDRGGYGRGDRPGKFCSTSGAALAVQGPATPSRLRDQGDRGPDPRRYHSALHIDFPPRLPPCDRPSTAISVSAVRRFPLLHQPSDVGSIGVARGAEGRDNVRAVGCGTVLAQLEFAFQTRNANLETDDPV
jgi:hypothetical protein